MRFLLNIAIPHEKFNALTKDGSVGKKLKLILDETKPEAVYIISRNSTANAPPCSSSISPMPQNTRARRGPGSSRSTPTSK